MKKNVGFILIITIILCFSGVISAKMINQKPMNLSELNQSDNEVEWLILFYFDADNNLESYALDDFIEISNIGSTEKVKFIMQLDRINGYDYRFDDWTGTKRFVIEKEMKPYSENAIEDLGEANMGNPDTLIDFYDWATNAYPSKKVSLILWDHGTGWKDEPRKQVCYDDTNGDGLETNEFEYMFSSISDNGEKKIDLIGFDACLMGMVEIAYELRNYSYFMTASEQTEPATGWNYEPSLQFLVNFPEEVDAETLGESFVNYYTGYDITLSTVNLTYMDSLEESISQFSNSIMYNEFRDDISYAVNYVETYSDLDYIDLYHFVEIIQDRIDDTYVDDFGQEVIDLLEILVSSNTYSEDNKNSNGLAIYFPYRNYDPSYENILFAKDCTWKDFLIWYHFGSQDSNPPSKPSIRGETQGVYGNNYNYEFISTDPDDDEIFYIIDWGDQSEILEYGPKDSGEKLDIDYSYENEGFFTIKARAKDTNGAYSDWQYYSVQMGRSRVKNQVNLFRNLIYNLENYLKNL